MEEGERGGEGERDLVISVMLRVYLRERPAGGGGGGGGGINNLCSYRK